MTSRLIYMYMCIAFEYKNLMLFFLFLSTVAVASFQAYICRLNILMLCACVEIYSTFYKRISSMYLLAYVSVAYLNF